MTMTGERAERLANYLTTNRERTLELLKLSPEEAVDKINADGNDFTLEEIKEFGAALMDYSNNVNEDGELDEASLTDVAGGSGAAKYYKAIGQVCVFTGAAGLGMAAAGIALFAMW